MTIEEAKGYLREYWPDIGSQLLNGTYQPQPVKRVEIPKPEGDQKARRALRRRQLIQQALLQFSRAVGPDVLPHSYGFRPGRSPTRRWPRHSNTSPRATTWC